MAYDPWANWNPAAENAMMAFNPTAGNPATLSGAGWGGQSHAELNANWQPTPSAQAAYSQAYPSPAGAGSASAPGAWNIPAPQQSYRPSNEEINSFWQANQGNPQAIVNAANQYGLTRADILGATGGTDQQWNDYTGRYGITQGANGFQINPSAAPAGAGMSGGLGASPQTGGLGSWGGYGGGAWPGIANDPNGGGAMGSNPYRGDVLNYLKGDMLDFTNRALQGVRSNFVGSGGLGGSRQGIAEADVINNAARNYGSTAANMLSGDYQFDKDLNTSSYNTNRGLDLQQMGLGAQMLGQANQMPWLNLQNAGSIYGNFSGLGGQGDDSTDWRQVLGGLVSGAGLAGKMGLWG